VSSLGLAHLPTPVEELVRASEALGVRLLVKRDDLTGLALGGNKARKLERIVAEALDAGCDTLVTGGGAQSNHVRQTAAAARHCGLECHAVLGGNPTDVATGNVLLDAMLGASLEYIANDEYYEIEDAITDAYKRLLAEGRRPFLIPVGGASRAGIDAYRAAADELVQQDPTREIETVFVADGSGGTHAGLLAGLTVHHRARVVGVDVGTRPDLPQAVRSMAADVRAKRDFGEPVIDTDHIGGGYGTLDTRTRDALLFAARTEGLLLDPVYTGKAFAAMLTWIRDGRIAPGSTVLFWHTGGQPALFARRYAEDLGTLNAERME
jgi:D-cysteine desulfhydrase family pyridoxal phosphate-dependent enzyme